MNFQTLNFKTMLLIAISLMALSVRQVSSCDAAYFKALKLKLGLKELKMTSKKNTRRRTTNGGVRSLAQKKEQQRAASVMDAVAAAAKEMRKAAAKERRREARKIKADEAAKKRREAELEAEQAKKRAAELVAQTTDSDTEISDMSVTESDDDAKVDESDEGAVPVTVEPAVHYESRTIHSYNKKVINSALTDKLFVAKSGMKMETKGYCWFLSLLNILERLQNDIDTEMLKTDTDSTNCAECRKKTETPLRNGAARKQSTVGRKARRKPRFMHARSLSHPVGGRARKPTKTRRFTQKSKETTPAQHRICSKCCWGKIKKVLELEPDQRENAKRCTKDNYSGCTKDNKKTYRVVANALIAIYKLIGGDYLHILCKFNGCPFASLKKENQLYPCRCGGKSRGIKWTRGTEVYSHVGALKTMRFTVTKVEWSAKKISAVTMTDENKTSRRFMLNELTEFKACAYTKRIVSGSQKITLILNKLLNNSQNILYMSVPEANRRAQELKKYELVGVSNGYRNDETSDLHQVVWLTEKNGSGNFELCDSIHSKTIGGPHIKNVEPKRERSKSTVDALAKLVGDKAKAKQMQGFRSISGTRSKYREWGWFLRGTEFTMAFYKRRA